MERPTAAAALALLVCLACTTSAHVPGSGPPRPLAGERRAGLEHVPLDPADVRVQPEGLTVEQSWILDLYTLFHSREYSVSRVQIPGSEREEVISHLLLPTVPGPHPLVLVFPILEGSHVVSEGLAKALVNRGFAVARMERHELLLAEAREPDAPARSFRNAILDARRLLDWLETRPEIDATRVAAVGVSTGAILALTLLEVDPRIDSGFFLMVGGNLPELLHDSREKPVRIFRDRIAAGYGLETRAAWISFMRPHLENVDPITRAGLVEPSRVLIVSGRFDRVVRPEHTRALWEALGQPTWKRFPAGHYQLTPFFWWAAARGADHLDTVFSRPE